MNLRIPATVEAIKANFDVLQLDLRGSREVTDTDGEAMEERGPLRGAGASCSRRR
ncbi:MAG: hypothetical protein H6891_00140 [Brucellaceae bacterium]|nr:hypothetical protein [Brucellaceae bacterium]